MLDDIQKKYKSALDIGSSHGNHTKIMRHFGLSVDQIDKYENNAEINNDFNTYNFKKKYDVIFCSHVIEHQRNVGFFLDKIFDTSKISPVKIMNYFISSVYLKINKGNTKIEDLKISPKDFSKIIDAIEQQEVSKGSLK